MSTPTTDNLDIVYDIIEVTEDPKRHIFAVLVDNEYGVLARVIGLFSGRGYNIESLTVAEVDPVKKRSRITIATSGTKHTIEQIHKLLEKMVPVHKVHDLMTEGAHVERELGLFKVVGDEPSRVEALRLADVFRARAVDSTKGSLIFELTGTPEKLDAFIDLMRPLGLAEICRTGAGAMARGAGKF